MPVAGSTAQKAIAVIAISEALRSTQTMRIAAILAVALVAVPAHAATVYGPATVTDGDSLEIQGSRIRLFGIDAPEASQTCDQNGQNWACGQASADRLRALIGDTEISCAGNEVDVYGRLLAVCTIGGVSLNRTMVAEGWATAFRRYSEDYVADEMRARTSKLGLWDSSFMAPEDYRMAQDAAAPRGQPSQRQAASNVSNGACAIKGNRSSRGDWIYHLPGMRYYAETQAEEVFCTEAEALAAGYRRSRAR